ncbi:MAG: Branched-chain amino acid transport protein (AzlD) [Deltaproteobacteria bacterium ADurb.Bin510]|nr:MAG: Branched-chain amino acid transport protein (AzlD) [Deltaproteobacteria bacterium ADurb.Bin510]
MSLKLYLICILGMGLVTYLPRWLPLIWLAGRDLNPRFVRWLKFVPACILSALVLPGLLIDPAGSLSLGRPEFLVALPTLLFGVLTRSLGGTVLVGMLLYWLTGVL